MIDIPKEEREKYPPFKILSAVFDDPSLSDAQKMRTGMAFTFALGRSSKGNNLDPALVREQAGWLRMKLGLSAELEPKLVDTVVDGFNKFCADQAQINGR